MVEEGIVAFLWALLRLLLQESCSLPNIVTLNVTERHDTGRHFNSKNKPVLEVQPVTASPLLENEEGFNSAAAEDTACLPARRLAQKAPLGSFEGRKAGEAR
jgi:hypothetical protein